MKRASVVMAVVAVMIGATVFSVLAQGRPNFSGTWEMDVERTRAENRARAAAAGSASGASNGISPAGGGAMGAASMSGGGGGSMSPAGPGGAAPANTVVKVTQTAASLTIERVSGQVWEKMVHKLDGTESVNVNGNSTMKLKSHWEGSKLVSQGTSETKLRDDAGTITATVKEVRWIEKPDVMVIETTRTVTNAAGLQVSSAGRPTTTMQYFQKKSVSRQP